MLKDNNETWDNNNWSDYKGLEFTDGAGEYKITHYRLPRALTILITKTPKEGAMCIANPLFKLSIDEFAMTLNRFKMLISNDIIKTFKGEQNVIN